MKPKCERCVQPLGEGEIRCFGAYEEGKKVWCEICFKDLQEYIKQRRQEEKVPELLTKSKKLLEECESNKKMFLNLIKETKQYIESLEAEFQNEKKIVFTEQKELLQ